MRIFANLFGRNAVLQRQQDFSEIQFTTKSQCPNRYQSPKILRRLVVSLRISRDSRSRDEQVKAFLGFESHPLRHKSPRRISVPEIREPDGAAFLPSFRTDFAPPATLHLWGRFFHKIRQVFQNIIHVQKTWVA